MHILFFHIFPPMSMARHSFIKLSSKQSVWRSGPEWFTKACIFFILFILFPLLCGVDVRWHTPSCNTAVHCIRRQSLLFHIILYFVQPSSLRSSSLPSPLCAFHDSFIKHTKKTEGYRTFEKSTMTESGNKLHAIKSTNISNIGILDRKLLWFH